MELTQEQIDAHNALVAAGAVIVRTYTFVNERPTGYQVTDAARAEIGKGIDLYLKALKLNPTGWSSMWALGKLHQSLNDNVEALKWFTKAHEIKPDQVDVLREAGLAALSIGAKDEALALCFAAVRLDPDDLGLQSNLALAYLLKGDDEHAEECAKVAVSRAPDDEVSQSVLVVVQEVRRGKRPRPTRFN